MIDRARPAAIIPRRRKKQHPSARNKPKRPFTMITIDVKRFLHRINSRSTFCASHALSPDRKALGNPKTVVKPPPIPTFRFGSRLVWGGAHAACPARVGIPAHGGGKTTRACRLEPGRPQVTGRGACCDDTKRRAIALRTKRTERAAALSIPQDRPFLPMMACQRGPIDRYPGSTSVHARQRREQFSSTIKIACDFAAFSATLKH